MIYLAVTREGGKSHCNISVAPKIRHNKDLVKTPPYSTAEAIE